MIIVVVNKLKKYFKLVIQDIPVCASDGKAFHYIGGLPETSLLVPPPPPPPKLKNFFYFFLQNTNKEEYNIKL